MKDADIWSVCKNFKEDASYGMGMCLKRKLGIYNGYEAANACKNCVFFTRRI